MSSELCSGQALPSKHLAPPWSRSILFANCLGNNPAFSHQQNVRERERKNKNQQTYILPPRNATQRERENEKKTFHFNFCGLACYCSCQPLVIIADKYGLSMCSIHGPWVALHGSWSWNRSTNRPSDWSHSLRHWGRIARNAWKPGRWPTDQGSCCGTSTSCCQSLGACDFRCWHELACLSALVDINWGRSANHFPPQDKGFIVEDSAKQSIIHWSCFLLVPGLPGWKIAQ